MLLSSCKFQSPQLCVYGSNGLMVLLSTLAWAVREDFERGVGVGRCEGRPEFLEQKGIGPKHSDFSYSPRAKCATKYWGKTCV